VIAEALAVAAHRLGADGPGVLARIGGVIGERARAAKPDKLQRATWLAAARLIQPQGFRLIHATWIEAALADLPERARKAVADGGNAVDVWLARSALAGFVAMPAAMREPDELLAWLEQTGADQLARAAVIAGEQAAARNDPVLAAALDRNAKPIGTDRELLRRCAGVAHDRLLRIGARTVASQFDALSRRQLLQRLPRAVALALRDELAYRD
jgi:hypothetical protein